MVRELELLGGRQLVIGDAHEVPDEAGAVVWDAALVLAFYLNSHGAIRDTRVGLEGKGGGNSDHLLDLASSAALQALTPRASV
jgi:hypothetical protein